MATRYAMTRIVRRVAMATLWASGFFLLGYFSMTLGRDVRVPLVALAAATIPFGMTARSVLAGMLRGAGLGLAAGLGIIWGMLVAKAIAPAVFDRTALTWAISAVFLAAAIASLFAIFAQRRQQKTRQSWED